eukprot:gene18554-20418_t
MSSVNRSYWQTIARPDLTQDGQCVPAFTNAVGYPGNCDFDNGLCMYVHDKTADFQWKLQAGMTPSYYTGPLTDVSKKGNYMYIESSSPRLNGDKARLVSGKWLQPISIRSPTCLRFFYHMYGHTMGTINVYIHYVEMDDATLIWQVQGNQGQRWNEAKIPINAVKPFKVIFEGETSYSYLGDAAIDDIKFTSDSACYIWPSFATPSDKRVPTIPVPKSLVQVDCGSKPAKRQNRIIGGTPSNPGDWPWHAILVNVKNSTNKEPVCGATLIMPDWVITSAHCVADIIDKSKYEIRLGAQKRNTLEGPEQEIGIKNIYVHQDFNKIVKFNNDAAMIRLNSPAMLSVRSRTGLACLPKKTTLPSPNQICWVTGFGRIWNHGPHPDVLLEGPLPLVSNAECSHMESYPGQITDQMFCAGYKDGGIDTCQGDSGGPLVCEYAGKWFLNGITSWGDGCGRPRKYGVYTNVTQMHDWIASVMAFPDLHKKAN